MLRRWHCAHCSRPKAVLITSRGGNWSRPGSALDEHRPEDIVAVCRQLDRSKNERLAGQLMAHLSVLATRFLAKRINPNRPNRGKDILDEVRTGMMTAILDPKAPDGLGYETAFFAKLQQRLIDEIRRDDKRGQRYEPFAENEDGEEIEPEDRTTLNPEEVAIMFEAIQRFAR